jgi:hypothetical protein
MEDTKTIASSEQLTAQLTNRDWERFWLRLMARCAWVLRIRYHVKWPNDELKDFSRNAIAEIINKIFITNERKWNLNKYPDFDRFILSALDSHINNTLKKSNPEVKIGDNDFLLDSNEELDLAPDEIIIGKELRDQIFDELQSCGADDNELLIFECLADGIFKPEEIKRSIGLNDRDFHNAWRKFKRKSEVIKLKLAANGY